MRRWLRRLAFLLALPLLAVALDRAFPLDLSRAALLSPELDDAAGRVLNLRPAADGVLRLAAGPDEVGADIVPLLLAREDRRFWQMPGVDPLALLRAAGQLLRYRRIVSGGSTIAMQLARLLEPHGRSVPGKLHDLARGLQLQAHLPRTEILRLYLTLAPMGGNVEGVRTASLLYFGREPAALTRSQAALLVSLVQSPARRRPDLHEDAAWQGAARVLAAAGDAEPVARTPIRHAPPPAEARHLADHGHGRTATTLDGDLQAGLEALVLRELASAGPDADIAALVIRNSDRAVLAYLGGARYFGPAGTVDMVRAPRSPGSALKPFIYAMAFDAGLAAPGTVLDGGAFRLGGYAPRDFDRAERGTVTAADALRQSLNRPAVRLLARVGPARFATGLQAAGARLVLPRGAAPSAALALGGAGISLFDLAGLYADLADGGTARPLHVTGTGDGPGHPVFSQQAASAVAAILRGQPPPPGLAAQPDHPVAYKTGTSYGFRDAWAAGFTPNHTVVVWVGRRDNTPRPGATGRDAAAPILFHVFGLLPPEPPVPDLREAVAAGPLAPRLGRVPLRPALRVMFPPGDVDLAFSPGTPIDLQAAGGAPPYRWLVDGMPLDSGSRAAWLPAGPGFAHVTVTDRAGNAASADVALVPEAE